MFDMSFISKNSSWGNLILGGCLDVKIDLSRNGGVESDIPLAVSAQEFTKCIAVIPSVKQWFIVIPSTNPPHSNLVTCKFPVKTATTIMAF